MDGDDVGCGAERCGPTHLAVEATLACGQRGDLVAEVPLQLVQLGHLRPELLLVALRGGTAHTHTHNTSGLQLIAS
jgi:hypothetical protein